VSSWSSLRVRLKPLLKDLQPAAQRVALLVCFTYELPLDPELSAEIAEERRKAVSARKALRKLDRGLHKLQSELESTLGDRIGSLSDEIRAAHIPSGSPALLPFQGDAGLAQYFRRKGVPDPAESLERFIALWPTIQKVASREIRSRRYVLAKRRGLWKTDPRHFWRRGGAEYALSYLFKNCASPRLLVKDIEERIAKLLQQLDGGSRSVDKLKGGCAAVREAIKRVRMDIPHKERCDRYIARQITLMSS
jgi:hypothetical protein